MFGANAGACRPLYLSCTVGMTLFCCNNGPASIAINQSFERTIEFVAQQGQNSGGPNQTEASSAPLSCQRDYVVTSSQEVPSPWFHKAALDATTPEGSK